MLWLSAVLVATVSNLDNLAAGVAFGMRRTRIAAAPNVVIAAVTMAATAGAMTSGRGLSHVLAPSLASALGASIIGTIGVWTIVSSLRAVRLPTRWPERGIGRFRGVRYRYGVTAGLGGKEAISLRQALVLGVALSLNNAATGVGAGVAGVSPLATTLLAGGLSLICVGGGARAGLALGRLIGGSRASLIAGLILLGVGAMILTGAG